MPDSGGYPALWDWRRKTASLYAGMRAGGAGEAPWQAWRKGRDSLFRFHSQTPIETPAEFTSLPFFPYDLALRFAVHLQPTSGDPYTVTAGADGPMQLRPFAITDGLAIKLGKELTIYWVESYGGGAFLPFTDLTSGHESYGGGRYLLDTIKGADLGTEADGRTVLDFNYAYHPSCSYSARYICPLAPPGNRLPVAVRAGEQTNHD